MDGIRAPLVRKQSKLGPDMYAEQMKLKHANTKKLKE
jgi:hypothetical protein